MPAQYRYRFGDIVYDESRQILLVGGLEVDVQPLPLQILSLLLARAGAIVSREELFKQFWRSRHTVENVVATAITKLRNALGPAGARLIENVPRVGYRFAGTFERVPAGHWLETRIDLVAGEPAPRRPELVLDRLLSQTDSHEVWLAYHPGTGEKRVLKFASDAKRLVSLKREVTISRLLADLLGPRADIVRILGWHFDSEPVFIESEYGGEDLKAWAADERLWALDVGERLAVLIDTANAIAAAHGVGVLHKDVKPHNVLLRRTDAGLQVALTDFGSGRLLEPERLSALEITAMGMTVADEASEDGGWGSLLYLAPEILQGKPATVRSDLYALGVLLYQLLVGNLRKPVAPGWERDIEDELLREDIALAVDHDPLRRVGSVLDWAQRLARLTERRAERHTNLLAQHAVELDREALRRARARRPWLIATCTTLILGLLGTSYLYFRVREAQQLLREQYLVSHSLNQFLTNQFIAMANPSLTGRKDVTVAEAARKAALRIDDVFGGMDPNVRISLHVAMQKTLGSLSDYPASEAEGRKALALMAISPPLPLPQQAEIRVDLAAALARQTKLAEAESQLAVVDSIAVPQDTPTALEARIVELRASIATERLANAQALELYRQAWNIAQHAPDISSAQRDDIHLSLADALRLDSQMPQAEAETLSLLNDERQRIGVDNPLTCTAATLLAAIEGNLGKFDQAIPNATQAAECQSKALGQSNIRTASAYDILAGLYLQMDRYKEAADAYRQVATIYTTLVGPQAMRTLTSRLNAAVSRQYAGDGPGAEAELSAILTDADSSLGWTHPTTQVVRYHLADCRLDTARSNDVSHLLDGISSDALGQGQRAEDWPGRVDYQWGRLYALRGDRPRATEFFKLAQSEIRSAHSNGRVSEAAIVRSLSALQKAPRGT